jgi:hypothetical protein
VDTPYVTLSYRWGESQSLTLRSDNIEQFRLGLSILSLPRTFQEAIEVACRLNVHYIWIDALCIIQGSPGDWQSEGPQMHNVYGRSYLNIGAADSPNPHGGLFRSRPYPPQPVVKVSAKWQGIIPGEFYCHDLKSTIPESHLAKRAWIFQERLLAPRMINFTGDQILWECGTTCN